MSGQGNCYYNAAVETIFKAIKAKLSGSSPSQHEGLLNWQCSTT